ncbi:MAG TPA: hypothetical protein VFS10_01970, partial [Pyrinomonadaceae bacterium]|nr:hypothetical protein [Pyrinomonadaceae bacterium]
MKSAPRTSRSPLAALLFGGACLFLLAPCAAHAQGGERPARKTPAPRAPAKEPKQKPARKDDAKARERRERRQAVAALVEVAEGARSLEDLEVRADVLSLAADALWPADETAARSVFRRAWEAATAADLADTKRREEEVRAQRRDGSAPTVAETTRARFETLGVLARRDARLAETLLGELKPSAVDEGDADGNGTREGATNENASARVDVERTLSPRGAQRLRLAFDLLRRGDAVRAARLALPLVAEGPAREFVRFLLQLRPSAPNEADALYRALLSRMASDASADANDVLVLSSYVVSPHLFITVNSDASIQLNPLWSGNREEAEGRSVPPALRGAFFDLAAALLLRPAPPQANERAALDEASALYFAAGRLLPFFERDAPRHAPAVRERMEVLGGGIEEARRERLSAHMPTGDVRPKNPSDPLEKFVKEMSDPVSRAERFGMRLRAVAEAARRKLWDRARKLAAGIEDADARREAST